MAKSEHNAPPTGTGNAAGLGEAFSINLNTGQGMYAYRLPLPEGVAAHTPQLALEYAHGTGHGAWGLGWRLSLHSITRRLDFGTPEEGLIERFLESGAEIMPIDDGTFRAVRETAFTRYTRVGEGWKIEERSGMVHELGVSAAGRITQPGHSDRPVEWLLERTTDISGNVIEYDYAFDNGIAYPQTIRYAIYQVRFQYEDRPDVRHDGRAGFSRRRTKRCSQVQLILDPGAEERIIRSWRFGYEIAPSSGVSLLTEIKLIAHGTAPNGSLDVSRPPMLFRYSEFNPKQFRVRWMQSEGSPPPGLTERDVALVTLDNAPLPGILMNRNGREYYWANRGNGQWAAPKPLRQAPLVDSFARDGLAFVDMDGSGTADLMVADAGSLQGFYENEGSAGWKDFVAFPRGRRSTPQWSDANLRMLDADGDGLVDALTSQKRAFVWWRNEGKQGWATPALIPKSTTDLLDIDLGDPDVHLADMTGDGLPDIVRIQSGRVEYWPNLGRGRFGARVVMQHSPRLRRSPNDTLLLTDLDDDGCTDLVVFTAQGLTIYPNQNGIRFTDPVIIDAVPVPIVGTVRAVNLNGHAGTGLIWNSHTNRQPGYVHLEFAAEPPYLMSHIENGAGLVSEIQYRSVVDDYLRDRRDGRLWTTNFPFPYLVVAHTRETDQVSGRVAEVDFKYHEAHFERHTRQFQGFRNTERIERGDASRPDTRQVHQFLMAQEKLPGNGLEHTVLNSLLSRVETYQLDGSTLQDRPYRVETSEHGLTVLNETADGRKRSFVFVTVHQREDTERTDDVRREEKTYTYDTLGNVVREVHRGSGTRGGVVQPARERTTEMFYAISSTHYLLDKPTRLTVRDQNGQLLSERRLYYDGPDFVGLPLGQADRGLKTREEEWVLTQADFDTHYADLDQALLGYVSDTNTDGVASVFAPAQRSSYNARGLPLASRDPLENETRIEYDASGLFRTKLTDPLGETLFEYDRATAQIDRATYADGAVTLFVYDAQGRVLKSALPGQTLGNAPTDHTYDETVVPNRRIVRFRQQDGTLSVGVTYFDGYGKEFQQRVEVEPGRFLVTGLKLYNPWGDLREEFEPTFANTSNFSLPDTTDQPLRRFFYDALGRTVRCINFNKGVSTAEYEPFRVITRDANDNDDSVANINRGQFNTPHEKEFDVFRYLVRVTEHLSAAKKVVTEYEVGVMGELVTASDSRGIKFRCRYDRQGTRLSITPREVGERKIMYDTRKNPVRTRDAANHDIRAAWDSLGRLQRLVSGPTVLEEYLYDTPIQNAFSRLAEVRYAGGKQIFTYDLAGRLTQRAYHYEGEASPHTLQYEYDPLGREIATVHTDGTRIDRQLTSNGWLKAIPNVIKSVQYNSRGLPTEIFYQNDVQTTYGYTDGPGRILQQTTLSPQNEVLAQMNYTFDKMEVMLSSNDTAPDGTGLRLYTYDPLYQLTSMVTSENGNPVTRVYDYADDYNLRHFEEARCTLHYDDAIHSDRLTGLTPDGGTLFNVAHSENGNVLTLPGQQFDYNAKNELMRFSKADGLVADYRYDHLGFRISKRVADGQGNVTRTLYVGDEAEIRDGIRAHFVRVGSMRLAVLFQGVTRFLHENSIGSTSFFTDAAGQRTGQLDYYPFGAVASRSGDVDFQTFSLHPVDAETGLVYMRRRYYSPQLGRFLTPDLMAIYQPEKFLHAPQGLHLYAFVANDPLNKTDPTGMSFLSFLGAVVGVVLGVGVALAIVAGVAAMGSLAGAAVGIGLALAVTGVSYAIAQNANPGGDSGDFIRGLLVGFNAGMNGVLATAIFGGAVGVTLGVINFLATFEGVARNATYQGILGWSSWLMPWTWAVTGLGLAIFLINVTVAGSLPFLASGPTAVDKIAIDWKTGSIVMVGGLIRNGTAFNMGHFVFVDPSAIKPGDAVWNYDSIVRHETGHTLSVAAFGTAFHLADFFGENVFGAGTNDYGERIAESHVGGPTQPNRPRIPMWG
jgi:RHS repeat-associated protein